MSYFDSVYADEELPHRARTVYMYLRDRSDAEGKCWPGIKTIAAELHGYLMKEHRFRGNGSYTSNLYTIKKPRPPP